MSFTIILADDDDIREIVRIMFKAYRGEDDYINAVFPRGLTAEGSEITTQRLLYIKNLLKGIKWEKATDATTGRIIGGAMWGLYEEEKPKRFPLDGPPGTWLTDEEKEYAQALFRSLGEDEEAYMIDQDVPLMRLSILAIDPEYHRQGAGTALVKSGLELTDSKRAATTLVSTPAGIGLYEKFGFYILNERDLHVPEKWAHRPKCHIWIMARDRKVEAC